MGVALTLLDYDRPNLIRALSNDYTTAAEIGNKNHFSYLEQYFSEPELVPKKILIEHSYVSRDYLVDYTYYFAKCFVDYPKKCKRVHFFKNEFTEVEFLNCISRPESETVDFWKNYLGFIVVKPIPVTMIGLTLLEMYPAEEAEKKRVYFGSRDYQINLFGNTVIKRSLAFQEQDAIVGACATSAVWSVLSKSSYQHHSILKTPSEITQDADIIGVSKHGWLYPNKGLSVQQMISAFSKAGLVCEVKTSRDRSAIDVAYVKNIVRAYAPLGVPVILGMLVPTGEKSDGLHAVAITGYRHTFDILPTTIEPAKLFHRSDSIDKFFIHDDQFGPFAKVEFSTNPKDLMTEWSKKYFNRASFATAVIVPIYHKIRLSFENIASVVHGINLMLTVIMRPPGVDPNLATITHNYHWDIAVYHSEDIKKKFKKRTTDAVLHGLLLQDLPKYIWSAECRYENEIVFQILFDATDLQQNMFAKKIIFYKDDVKAKLHKALSSKPSNYADCLRSHVRSLAFVEFLIQESKP